MIKSMTGYGRANSEVDSMAITVEVKSVNHRYFELSSRIPRTYGFLDEKVKSYLQSVISRGKVECYIQIDALEMDDVIVRVNHSLAGSYVAALKELADRHEIKDDISVSSLIRYGDIFSVHKEQADEDRIWQAVKCVLSQAVDSFIKMREKEGEKLKDDMLLRAGNIISEVEFIEQRSGQVVKEYTKKLENRIKELLEDAKIDDQRILMEAAIFSDKTAVDEETVRLRSHIDQLRMMLSEQVPIGRKLDFLVQEINREANTIGSKAQDVAIAKRVLEIKSEVEKIREQVQNIE
ncbi:MAG: YicC family protein [Oscillospiraceae bacterium]|nr:YicC family protein [Oscillospiraceae bacterium]